MIEVNLKPLEGLEAKLWKRVSSTIESTFDFGGAGTAVVAVRPLTEKVHSVYIIPEEGSVIGQVYVRPKSKPKLNSGNKNYVSAFAGNFLFRIYYEHIDRSKLILEKRDSA